MERWYDWKKWLILSTTIPAAVIMIWPGSRIINLLAIAWIAVVLFIYFHKERSHHETIISQTIKSTQKQGIRTMNHHRHDWMNELQVLYGYIRLNKLDRCIEYVEKIKEKMFAESSIAKLEEPMLVSYLQAFRTMTSHFSLVVDIQNESDQQTIIIDNEAISQYIISVINTYRIQVYGNTDEELQLVLKLHKRDDSLFIAFLFNGELVNEEQWVNKIEQQIKSCTGCSQADGALNFRRFETIFSST